MHHCDRDSGSRTVCRGDQEAERERTPVKWLPLPSVLLRPSVLGMVSSVTQGGCPPLSQSSLEVSSQVHSEA